MLELIAKLADVEIVPAFCLDEQGNIQYGNAAWKTRYSEYIGFSIAECFPEFFSAEYDPDYARFSSQQTLYDTKGHKLEIIRFGSVFICRLQDRRPENLIPMSGEEELFRIRSAAHNIFRTNSEAEDLLYDEENEVERQAKAALDTLCAPPIGQLMLNTLNRGNISARRILLGCNRVEINYMANFSGYPPQRIDLSKALDSLLRQIRLENPGMRIPIEGKLEICPTIVSINWELFKRALLEAIRMEEKTASKFAGTTVLGIELMREIQNARIILSENRVLYSEAEDQQTVAEGESMNYIWRVIVYYGGEVIRSRNKNGEHELQIKLPLLKHQKQVPETMMLHSGSSYNYAEKVLASDILVYLEPDAEE